MADPEAMLKEVYKFIGQEYEEGVHDFENVEMERDEYDSVLNAPGLHTVRKSVTYEQKPMLLPDDIQQYLSGLNLSIYKGIA